MNNTFEYDLQVGQIAEGELSDIFSLKKIEVKTDLMAEQTGFFFLEYQSRGKPSGIATTQADFYAIKYKTRFLFIAVEELKDIARKRKPVKGGDNLTSLGVLIPIVNIIL